MEHKEYQFHLREMRKKPTDSEKVLWALLRSRKLKEFKFRRQHPIGPYIVDFCCLQKRLIIELDGAHHLTQEDEDQKRTEFLKDHGFTVIRFWNSQIEEAPGAVVGQIESALKSIKRRLSFDQARVYHWVNPLPREGEGAG